MVGYAVIFSYSFDDDVVVYLFESEKSAAAFLKESYSEELRIDVEENGWDAVGHITDDGWYAEISNYFQDHVDTTVFRIGRIYS